MRQVPAFVLSEVVVRRCGVTVLDGVSAVIGAGTCTAVTGPSGAGKTTLLRLLNRLDDPASGRITYRGVPIDSLDVVTLRRRVGLVAQHPTLLTARVADELRAGNPALDDVSAVALLTRVGLDADFLHRATTGLSGGEAQRVCLARALALDPEVLVADEPTASLDAASAAAVDRIIADLVSRGRTVVMACHDVERLRLADQVLVLRAGQVVEAGPPSQLDYLRSGS